MFPATTQRAKIQIINKICERRDSDPGFSLGKAMSYQTRLHSHKQPLMPR